MVDLFGNVAVDTPEEEVVDVSGDEHADISLDPHPKFTDLTLDHASIERELIAQFNDKRLASAYIFSGIRGIGKATMAYGLAKFLLSNTSASDASSMGLFGEELTETKTDTFELDANLSAVKRIKVGSHADLLVIEPEFDKTKNAYKKEITIDQVRKISAFISLSSVESQYKVIIVDSIDLLNKNAANAILKRLEEPPEDTIFILISHNIEGLLDTIISRCRVVKFSPPKFEAFTHIIESRGLHIESETLRQLYDLSAGSAGVAIDLYIAGAVEWYDELQNILQAAPAIDQLMMYKFADTAVKEDVSWTNKVMLMQHLLFSVVKEASLLSNNVESDASALVKTLAQLKPLGYWVEAWEHASAIFHDANSLNLDKKQTVNNIIYLLSGQYQL